MIFGAGVIGLSLALELRIRGSSVIVLDPRQPLSGASAAAAGMLAVEDPHNSAKLLPLSRLSGSLYAAFLSRVKEFSGLDVPFQTMITRQTMPDGTVRPLSERSIDPRQLAPALLHAVMSSGVRVLTGAQAEREAAGLSTRTGAVVRTAGAWGHHGLPVTPRKGQMLRVQIPRGLTLPVVHRNEHVYVVPRTTGPQAGTALLGATVEDAGFDTSTSSEDLRDLRRLAAELVPQLGDEAAAPAVEAWAGLRPATPDGLPILGVMEEMGVLHAAGNAAEHPLESPAEHLAEPSRAETRMFIATGHFRNGILLAPATAVVMADLLEDRTPAIDLAPFTPARFAGPRRG